MTSHTNIQKAKSAPLMPPGQCPAALDTPRQKPVKAPKPKQRPQHKRLPAPAANLCPPGYVGFLSCDWADQSHELRFWNAAKGELTPYQIDTKPETLQPFLHSLRDNAGEGKIGVIVENHHGSFINQVREMTGFVLHPVNPKTAAKYRQALHPSGAKSDPIDTDALLRFGLSHLDLCPAPAEDTAENRLMGRLSEVRRQFVNEATAVSNKLTAVLKGFFPQAFELIGELDRPLAWAFLERWPSLQDVKKAGSETIRKFYYQHNSRRPQKMDQRLAIIQTALPLSNDSVLYTTETYHIKALVAQLKAICQSVAKYETKLEQSVEHNPDYAIFKSVPGAGSALIPRLISLFGSDRARWPDALSLLTQIGVAPIIKSSGTVTVVQHRHACPKYQRQTLIELAATSNNAGCPWVRNYVASRQAKGWRYPRILRAIAFKWGRILWKLWQDHGTYIEKAAVTTGQHPGPEPAKKQAQKSSRNKTPAL